MRAPSALVVVWLVEEDEIPDTSTTGLVNDELSAITKWNDRLSPPVAGQLNPHGEPHVLFPFGNVHVTVTYRVWIVAAPSGCRTELTVGFCVGACELHPLTTCVLPHATPLAHVDGQHSFEQLHVMLALYGPHDPAGGAPVCVCEQAPAALHVFDPDPATTTQLAA